MSCGQSVRAVLTTALWIGALGVFGRAQDSGAPNPSLADIARQSRVQHEATGQPSKAQELVDEMQREQEAEQAAPTGFKSYDAGDYRLFVPYPYSLEGRDKGGAVLLGSRLGVTNTEVMAGAPVPIPPNLKDIDVQNLARQVALQHSQSGYCEPIQHNSRKTFRCAMGGINLLGHQVWGNMEIVVASNKLIPVMCVSPDDLQQCVNYNQYGYQTCGNRYPSWEEVQRAKKAVEIRYRDELTTAQMCEQIIYPSIQLKEDIVVHPVMIGEGKTAKAGPVPLDNSVAAYGVQGPSLADLARQTRQAQQHKPQATPESAEGDVAPQGFQSFALQYCQNPQHCSEASVVIPEKAEVVSRTNGQYIFKTLLNGDPVLLYAGPADVNMPYRSMSDPDFVRMRDLANSNGWSHERTDGVSTQELTIAGRPALMTRFRYQRDGKIWWMGERAVIQLQTGQVQTGQFLLGCTSPEQRFADAEALCTTLVNSLRLQ
jgi:hypothetical protein